LKLGIKMLIHKKDNIQFGTEFSRFLGHPVAKTKFKILKVSAHETKSSFTKACIEIIANLVSVYKSNCQN